MLSLDEEIDFLMNLKHLTCDCNPCICPPEEKQLYFQLLKRILKKFNEDYMYHLLIPPTFSTIKPDYSTRKQ